MEQTSLYDKNPWETDDAAHAAVRNVLGIAQSTGHVDLHSNSIDDLKLKKAGLLEEAEKKFHSLKILETMKLIEENRNSLEKVILEIQKRLSDKETQDLTHSDILEKRIEDVNELNAHLQTIVDKKDQLLVKLQQPYVGDFLKIEAPYKKYVSDVFPQLVPVLSDLNCHLENITWAGKADVTDGKLEHVLTDVSTNIAALQSEFQGFCQMRHSVTELHGLKTQKQASKDGYS